MPAPVTRNLLVSLEVGTGTTNVSPTWNGSAASGTPTNGGPVQAWTPLAQGNSAGIFATASGTADAGIYVASDFSNGLGGIKGGAHCLAGLTPLIALGDFNVWVVSHSNAPPSSNDRVIDTGFGTGFMLMSTGTTAGAYTAGVLSGAAPYGSRLTAADPNPHIFHFGRRTTAGPTTTLFFEVDGHSVAGDAYALAATQLASAQLFLLGTTTDSPSTWSLGTVYVYGTGAADGGMTTLEINQTFNYLGPKYSISLAGVPGTGGGGILVPRSLSGGLDPLSGEL